MVPLPKELAEKFLRDELARELPPSARPGTATSRLGGDGDLPGPVLGLPAPLMVTRPACVPPIGTGLGVRYRRRLEEEQLLARADMRVAKMEAIHARLHPKEPSDVEAASRTFELHDRAPPTSPPAKPPRASLWMSNFRPSLWTSKVEKKAAKKTEEEEAARKGASGGNSMAPLGQPPASQAQLDTQQQLA